MTSLIAGMDDVIEYIKKMEKENKALKEDIDDAVENYFADLKLRETTHKEWDALVKENEKLKKFKKDVVDATQMDDDLDDDDYIDYIKEMEEGYDPSLQEENEKLKQQNHIYIQSCKTLQEDLKNSEDKVCELTHEKMELYGVQDKIDKLQEKIVELEKFKKEAEETTKSFPVVESMMDQLEEKDKDIKSAYERTEQVLRELEYQKKTCITHDLHKKDGTVIVKFDWCYIESQINAFVDCYTDGHYDDSDYCNLDEKTHKALYEDVAKELSDMFNAVLFDKNGNIEGGGRIKGRGGGGDCLQETCWDRMESMILDKYLDKMKVDVTSDDGQHTRTIPLERYRDLFVYFGVAGEMEEEEADQLIVNNDPRLYAE